jgi:hypothetical protein
MVAERMGEKHVGAPIIKLHQPQFERNTRLRFLPSIVHSIFDKFYNMLVGLIPFMVM